MFLKRYVITKPLRLTTVKNQNIDMRQQFEGEIPAFFTNVDDGAGKKRQIRAEKSGSCAAGAGRIGGER